MAVQSDDEDDTKNGATLLVPTNSAFDVSNTVYTAAGIVRNSQLSNPFQVRWNRLFHHSTNHVPLFHLSWAGRRSALAI
jgi:hypothetical protein